MRNGFIAVYGDELFLGLNLLGRLDKCRHVTTPYFVNLTKLLATAWVDENVKNDIEKNAERYDFK
jgi:hypothetical protein